MTTIDIDKLGKAKGVGKEAAAALADVFDTYEELASATPQQLIAVVDGLNKTTAAAAIAFAQIKAKVSGQPVPIPTQTGPMRLIIEEQDPEKWTDSKLREVFADEAARSQEVIDATLRRFRGLRLWAKDDQGRLDLSNTNEAFGFYRRTGQIPQDWDGHALYTVEEIIGHKTWADPFTRLAAPKGNVWLQVPPEKRVFVTYGLRTNRLTGREDPYTLVTELTQNDLRKHPRWQSIVSAFERDKSANPKLVGDAEEDLYVQEGRPASMPPFATGGGGNPTPINWPRHLDHASQMRLIEELERFSIEELIEVARTSRVDHENLPWRQKSAFKRELVMYHQRRDSVASLMEALQVQRSTVNWAAVIGIVDEKAGAGDVIFGNQYGMSGDFRGAHITIGDRHDK